MFATERVIPCLSPKGSGRTLSPKGIDPQFAVLDRTVEQLVQGASFGSPLGR